MVTGRTKVALVLGSLLTLGGIVYAQAVDSQYRANDGIDSTPSIVPFSDDDSINLKKILGTGGTFDFIDPVVWLQGKLNFLEENGPRVRKHFTPTLRQIRIRDTMKLLAQVRNEKEKRDVGYFNSQRNLEGEVKNGEFIPKGLETGVTYAIVERWPG